VVQESIDDLHSSPHAAMPTGPAFTVLDDHPLPPGPKIAGAILTIALFGAAIAAMEHWRGTGWRGDLYTAASAPRLSEGGMASLPTSGSAPAVARAAGGAIVPASILDDVLASFDQADVVALGEFHGSLEDSALRISLIRRPDFPRKVRYILVEFGNSLHQQILDRYIQGADVPTQEIQKVWRDITTPGGADSPMYAQLLSEVRTVNQHLPDHLKIRVLAGDPPIDWSTVRNRDDWLRFASKRDAFAADLVSREVLEKGRKALIIYGAGHIWRNARGGPFPGNSTLVPLLDRKYPGRIYTILPISGGNSPSANLPALLPLKGIAIGDADPNEYLTRPLKLPFRLFPHGVKLADVADACVFHAGTLTPPAVREDDPAYTAEKARRLQLIAPPK